MHPAKLIYSLFLITSLSACATLPPGNPKPVEVGTGASEQFDRANTILYFPAGKPLPFRITANGSVFAKPIDHTETFVLNRDIYTWGDLASFDGKHWKPGNELITGEMQFFFNPKNVRFNVDFNTK